MRARPDDPRRFATSTSRPPPDVMSAEEIRYWLTALHDKHGWGWTGLGRTLGMNHPGGARGKADGTSWLFPTEQLRFSRVLKRIISGELVYRPGEYIPAGCKLADQPVPLVQPVVYQWNAQLGRMQRFHPRIPGVSRIPSFRAALKNAGRWRECTFPEDERRERDA